MVEWNFRCFLVQPLILQMQKQRLREDYLPKAEVRSGSLVNVPVSVFGEVSVSGKLGAYIKSHPKGFTERFQVDLDFFHLGQGWFK